VTLRNAVEKALASLYPTVRPTSVEGVLIHGAQGERTLTVLPLARAARESNYRTRARSVPDPKRLVEVSNFAPARTVATEA